MAKKHIHVVPTEKGFGVRVEGNDRLSKDFDTQKKAIEYGRDRTKEDKVDLKIHGRDGKIRDSDSYGSDPNPPKDKKH